MSSTSYLTSKESTYTFFRLTSISRRPFRNLPTFLFWDRKSNSEVGHPNSNTYGFISYTLLKGVLHPEDWIENYRWGFLEQSWLPRVSDVAALSGAKTVWAPQSLTANSIHSAERKWARSILIELSRKWFSSLFKELYIHWHDILTFRFSSLTTLALLLDFDIAKINIWGGKVMGIKIHMSMTGEKHRI